MKGVPFSNKRYTKGVPFLKKWYIKGEGLDLGEEPPRIKRFEYPPGLWREINKKKEIDYKSLYKIMRVAVNSLQALTNLWPS